MRRRRITRRRLLAAGGGLFASAVAGCLDESPGEDDPELGDPEPFVEVELASDANGVRVEPPVVHLVDGGTIEWVVESANHDVTAYHPATHGEQRRIPEDAEPWASETMGAGDSYDRTFDVEGVYDYASTPHEADGAVGSVVVGWPDPDSQPGLEPPATDLPIAAIDALEEYNERVRDLLEEVHD